MQLLDLLGFRPELHNCLNCEKEVQAQDQFFSTHQGGVICPDCESPDPTAHPISMGALKYMRHFQRSTYTEASRARMPKSVYLELETLMDAYLTYLLECQLNSPQFLRRMRKAVEEESEGAEHAAESDTSATG